MKAEDTRVTNLLEGAKQFIVPIFRRDYGWGTKHCQQLWKDVIRVGSGPNIKGRFLGSAERMRDGSFTDAICDPGRAQLLAHS